LPRKIIFDVAATMPGVGAFKTMFPTAFKFAGNRALVFDEHADVPVEALRICIEMALTYHAKSHAGA